MSLSCEEVELSLLEPGAGEEVRAHLAGCERCRAFEADLAKVTSLAALPEPQGAERARLLGLAPRTLSAVRARDGRRVVARQVAGLALAAGVGALVAGLALRPSPRAAGGGEFALGPPAEAPLEFPLAVVDDGVVADSDDDVEIAWPSPLEGDAP